MLHTQRDKREGSLETEPPNTITEDKNQVQEDFLKIPHSTPEEGRLGPSSPCFPSQCDAAGPVTGLGERPL